MVTILRKASLPNPADVATRLAPMAAKALTLSLRERVPPGSRFSSPSTGN